MKYLILSDIHGSSKYLKEVLSKESFDKILLLGDILPHGPRNDLPEGYNPKEVISILNPIADKIIAVAGNCDAEVDQMVLKFPLNNLAMIEYNNIFIYLTHGHHFNQDNPLMLKEGIVLYGHTHISKVDNINGVIYINPGSLSIPKDTYHSYAVLENNRITIKQLNGKVLHEVNLWS